MHFARLWIALIFVCFSGLFALVVWLSAGDLEKGEEAHVTSGTRLAGLLAEKPFGGPFTLLNQHGQVVHSRDFPEVGRLVYFGFTYCPDVCPSSLSKMTQVVETLDESGIHVQPVFITIDSQRDTPEVLAEYLSHFHARFVGLTGMQAQLEAVFDTYRVFVQKKAGSAPGDYLFDHTSFIFFTGPDDRVIGVFETGLSAPKIAAAISATLG